MIGVIRTKSTFFPVSVLLYRPSDILPTFLKDFTASALLARVQSRLAFGKTAFLRVVTAFITKQSSGFFCFDAFAGRECPIELVPVLVHMHLAIEETAQCHPNILVSKRPSVKIENCVLGILGDFFEQLLRPFCFRGEVFVRIILARKRRVKVDAIELFQRSLTSTLQRVCEHYGLSYEIVHPPEFRADIAGVQDRFAVTFYEKHDSANAVVCIKQSDADALPRRQIYHRRRRKWNRLEQQLQVAIRLLAGLEDAFCEVHAVRVLFQTQQDRFGRRRAVYEW